jgi:hypothetical protein
MGNKHKCDSTTLIEKLSLSSFRFSDESIARRFVEYLFYDFDIFWLYDDIPVGNTRGVESTVSFTEDGLDELGPLSFVELDKTDTLTEKGVGILGFFTTAIQSRRSS